MKRFIVLLSAVILCLTLAGCSGSQYKKATELYEQGNYAEAGGGLRLAAKQRL